MSTKFQLPIRVYIEDTDAGGVVYHSQYLNFFERGRTEMLRAKGFGKNVVVGDTCIFVVHSLSIDYLRPARLDDALIVESGIIKFARTYWIFEQKLFDGEQLLCSAVVKVACINKSSFKPAVIPKIMQESLQQN